MLNSNFEIMRVIEKKKHIGISSHFLTFILTLTILLRYEKVSICPDYLIYIYREREKEREGER